MSLVHLGLLVLPLAAQIPVPASRGAAGDAFEASGEREIVFRAPTSGMYRVHVQGDAGTSCSIADHLRGPFASSGVTGEKNCDLDLMLDAGLYKARLTSPARGKGRARLLATPFAEASPPVKLDEGAQVAVTLRPRTHMAGWLHLEKRQSVTLEVAGRTAGVVSLWRDGTWLEDVSFDHKMSAPRSGKEIHRWRLDAVLEPGEYKLVVSGADAKAWTKGPDEDVVFITRGAPPGGATRSRAFTIPAWGFVQYSVEHAAVAAFVELDQVPQVPVRLSAEAVRLDAALGHVRARSQSDCVVAAGQAVPACSVTSGGGSQGSHVLMIEGAPGTKGELSWGPLATAGSEGYWSVSSTPELTIGVSGTYFVTAPALPLSMDAEPLGCAIDEIDREGRFLRRVAVDAPAVSWTTPFERKFNSDGTSTSMWVQIERPGLYEVKGAPALKASCEVFKLDNWKKERVGAGADGACAGMKPLGAGLYEIRFYGGRPGIQTLRVAQVGLGGKASTPAKSSCAFESLALTRGRYRLVTSSNGGARLRAFFARGAPSSLGVSLPLVVDPGRALRVPVTAGAPVMARVRPDHRLRCTLDGVDVPVAAGVCQTGPLAAAGTLTLTTPGDRPITAVVSRVEEPPPPVPTPAWNPALVKLPTLTADAPLWMTFDRDQSRSMHVVVSQPGLYDLATEGLLSTSCRLRTPTIGRLVEGSSNGRGRNCQVQAYLKPGTYLFTATTQGNSRGRAGARLVQRPPRDLGTLAIGDEVFFRVPAGELAQQTLDVKKGGVVEIGTSAQGAQLSCRFDDHDGWPLTAVPAPCHHAPVLEPGRYLLTTLPLTVDSRRRTSLVRPREETVLQGEKTHPLVVNRPYQAQLGADGRDSFSFTLAAELEIAVALDHGMQGRIARVVGKAREVVETVPPVGGGGLGLAGSSPAAAEGGEEYGGADEGQDGEDEEAGDAGEYGEYEGTEGYEETEGHEGDDGAGGYEAQVRARREEARRVTAAAAMARVSAPQEVPPLAGHVVRLPAGTYILETEHSRGDVAIRYGVRIGARALAPDVTLTAPVPGRVDVMMPAIADARAGLLRVKTRGDVDVRCRLRDGTGVLVAESAESGADWNCALAVPLSAGRYTLHLEAETLQPGSTELSAAFLEAKDTGELKDGDTFRVVAKVAAAPLPAAGPEVVQDVLMTSAQDFSCAVQDERGAVLDRRVSVRSCRFLLWPGDEKARFHVFAWTPDRAATVKVALKSRRVRGFGGGGLDDDEVGRARVETRGRYRTGAGALCRLAARGAGPLTPCAEAASFPAGDVLVAVAGGGRVELKEDVEELAGVAEEPQVLLGDRAPQRQRSRGRALHLVEVKAPFGSASSPSCALDGGVVSHEAATCFAATGPVEESTLTTWTRGGAVLPTSLARRAAPWPGSSGLLAPGASSLSWRGESARWSLPAEGFRVKVALPSRGWALFVDDAGHARDLCAPRRNPAAEAVGAMKSCVLRGRGGELVLVSPPGTDASGQSARAELLVLSTAEAPRALVGLRETKPAMPGRERVLVAASPQAREVRVEGWGVLACAIHLEHGGHVAGCRAKLPPGQGAEILVEHDERPWRVLAHGPGELMGARYGALPTGAAPPVALGTAAALAGNVVQRRLDLKAPSAVRVRATSGVCAVATGGRVVESQGLGAGCDIVRVLPAGSHLVAVRGFGTAPLSGNVNVSAEPVIVLDEGVNAELIAAAGDVRTFRFDLAGDGEVGVGMQTPADALSCRLLDERQQVVGDGCHQFHRLARGTYYLRVDAPDDGPPRRFKPVVFGLKGSVVDVPEAWLRDFFARIPREEAR